MQRVNMSRDDLIAKGGKVKERDGGRIILAWGEATGHAHAVGEAECELVELPTGEAFIISDKGISLRHEEHGAINLSPGCYRLDTQKEYSPEAIRDVAD